MTKKELSNIRKLAQKKHRLELGLFVAEGEKAINEIIDGGMILQKLYATESSSLKPNSHVEIITKEEMSKISFLQTPSSLFGLFKLPRDVHSKTITTNELVLMLDGVQDPGNLGTIIRLADWFGITKIFCSFSTADCFNPKVVQATMGAIARVSIVYTDLIEMLKNAQQNNIPICGTFMNGDNIYTTALPQNGILLMGNEGSGITTEVESLVTHHLTIPSFKDDNVESLNVAIATSICCSEFRRRLLNK